MDIATTMVARDTLSLYVVTPGTSNMSFGAQNASFVQAFLADLSWSLNTLAPSFQLPVSPNSSTKLAKVLDLSQVSLAQTQLWLES